MPDFQETRPRNYVLSASASAVRSPAPGSCLLLDPASPTSSCPSLPDLNSGLVLCCFQHFNVTWTAQGSSDSASRIHISPVGVPAQGKVCFPNQLPCQPSSTFLVEICWIFIARGATERNNLQEWPFWMVPAVQWQYHTCDCLICTMVSVRGFEAGQESKGGGISVPPVSVTVEDCLFCKQRSFFYCFIVLAAVLQPDVPGVGEQPAVSPLRCTEWMWPSN